MNKMKKMSLLFFFMPLFQITLAQKNTSQPDIEGLKAAELKMFASIMKADRGEYLKNYLSEDYFSINADGSTVNKAQLVADSLNVKMFEGVTLKNLDEKIKTFDNVGIITGRAQGFMNDKLGVEFLYTAVFVKEDGKWMFRNWQGTISKDSPPPPSMPKS